MAEPGKDSAAAWLAAARAGSREGLGQALEACRAYLLGVANKELDHALQAKGGASDLVQETFLEAQRDFPRFQGSSEAELLAWLRQILLHRLGKFARRFSGTQKRQVASEIPLTTDGSSTSWQVQLAADATSPSGLAMAQEQAESLRQALERLPEDYRQVLALRYQQGKTFEEIGELLGRSADAARKVWWRAIERLQKELGQSS